MTKPNTPKYKALYTDASKKLIECVGHLMAEMGKVAKLEKTVDELAAINTRLQETVAKQTAALLKFTPDKQDKTKSNKP